MDEFNRRFSNAVDQLKFGMPWDDSFLTPLWLIDHDRTSYSLTAIDLVDTRARYLGLESVVIGDEYLFYKDAYLQSREFEIKDGEIEDDFDEFDDFN